MKRSRSVRLAGALLAAGLSAVACNSASNSEPSATPLAAAPTVQPEPRGAERLRLATWNLAWLDSREGEGPLRRTARDFSRLAEYARRLDADIIAVQEVDGEAALRRVFPSAAYEVHTTQGNGRQRVGFAWKRGLLVTPLPDYTDLAFGHLREGADLRVRFAGRDLRLLSVHLKAGCASGLPDDPTPACRKLHRQVPALERWIDARAAEGVPFAVLGDFNRWFFASPDEVVWRELDDAVPAGADLAAPSQGRRPGCWGGRRKHFIDHLVFGSELERFVRPESFRELLYDEADAPFRKVLSDHCATSIVVASPPRAPGAAPGVAPSAGPAPGGAPTAGVKGNISRGRKLYHLEGCPNYERVVIDEARGERVFQSEAEARAAGFVKANDCP